MSLLCVFMQLCFFKKALNSLEEVEPHVQMVTESQHIDYHFSGLEDDDEIENNEEDDSEVNDDGELSFEYRMSDKDQNADSSPSVSSQVIFHIFTVLVIYPVYPFWCF